MFPEYPTSDLQGDYYFCLYEEGGKYRISYKTIIKFATAITTKGPGTTTAVTQQALRPVHL